MKAYFRYLPLFLSISAHTYAADLYSSITTFDEAVEAISVSKDPNVIAVGVEKSGAQKTIVVRRGNGDFITAQKQLGINYNWGGVTSECNGKTGENEIREFHIDKSHVRLELNHKKGHFRIVGRYFEINHLEDRSLLIFLHKENASAGEFIMTFY